MTYEQATKIVEIIHALIIAVHEDDGTRLIADALREALLQIVESEGGAKCQK
jgi:hypothetical protein